MRHKTRSYIKDIWSACQADSQMRGTLWKKMEQNNPLPWPQHEAHHFYAALAWQHRVCFKSIDFSCAYERRSALFCVPKNLPVFQGNSMQGKEQ